MTFDAEGEQSSEAGADVSALMDAEANKAGIQAIDDAALTSSLETGASGESAADDEGGEAEAGAETVQAIQATEEGPRTPLDYLRELGVDLGTDDNEAALQQLVQSHRNLNAVQQQLQQQQAFATLGYQMRSQWEQFQAYQNQQRAAAAGQQQGQQGAQLPGQVQTQQQAAAKKWAPPEWNPEWATMVKRDENGLLVPVSQYISPAVVEKVQARLDWEADARRRQLEDPLGVLREAGLEGVVRNLMQEQLQAQQQQIQLQQRQQWANNAVGQHLNWIVAHDQNGQPLRHPVTGHFVPSPAGEQYKHWVVAAGNNGANDEMAHEFALVKVQQWHQEQMRLQQVAAGQTGQAAAAGQPQAAALPARDPKGQFLAQVNPKKPARTNGAAPRNRIAPEAVREEDKLGQMLAQNARAAGIL